MLEKTYVVGYVSRCEPTQVWAMGRGVRHWCATPRSHVGTRLHDNTIQPPPWPSGLGRSTPCPCWSYGVREVVSSNPDRDNIVGWVFHPTRWLARFSLIWKCLSFQILNLFRTLSSWGSDNYRPSAPLLYEVASPVKQLPFRPILL